MHYRPDLAATAALLGYRSLLTRLRQQSKATFVFQQKIFSLVIEGKFT